MRKPSTLVLVLGAGLLVLACSQDLSIPYSDAEQFDAGASGRPSTVAKGGRGGAMTAGTAGGGRFGVAGSAQVAGRSGASPGGSPNGADGGASGDAGAKGGASGSAGSNPGNGAQPAAGASGETGLGGAAGDGAIAGSPDLLFSEYVEGSGTFKALEILGLSSGSLEGCSVELYFNGNLEASSKLALHGAIESGAVHTLCSSALAAELGAACNQTLNLNYNGDDAIALVCQSEFLDVIGQIGVDPGSAWGGEVVRTADRSLRRRCDLASGDDNGVDAFDPALEWQAFPIDTFDGLGALSCENQ